MRIVNFLTGVRREYILALILTGLLVFSLLGYLFEGHHIPLRVAFNSNGGGIIFDHKLHMDLDGLECIECHHNYEKKIKLSSGNFNCRSCHYLSKNVDICKEEPIHKHCIGKNCMKCHIKESVTCDFCHNAKKFKRVPEPKVVVFETGGGRVVFDHNEHSSIDGYDLECKTCHHNYHPENQGGLSMNCRQCHYNTKYSSLCENEETHTRCIGKHCVDCHRDGEENCEICHKDQ